MLSPTPRSINVAIADTPHMQDLAHLTRILSALRASDAVAQAERL